VSLYGIRTHSLRDSFPGPVFTAKYKLNRAIN
jgi:hypothetical protein